MAERALSESSKRFFVFEGSQGEEFTADLKSYSAKGCSRGGAKTHFFG